MLSFAMDSQNLEVTKPIHLKDAEIAADVLLKQVIVFLIHQSN